MLDLSLISPRKRYLVAVSGGRDSVCLLHLLLEHGFRNLTVMHFDHMLRNLESSADARFVRDLARSHGLDFAGIALDVAKESKASGRSLEEGGRFYRHMFFSDTARSRRCNRVLLAHHADDNAETILFNLLRGSGGLKGIPANSFVKFARRKLQLIRPLLQVRRAEIDRYIAEHDIAFREDSSNASPAHTRNRLRHEALPLLADVMNRDPVPAILRAAEVSREHFEITKSAINSLDVLDPQGRIHLPSLRALAPALQRAFLFRYLELCGIPDLSKDLIDRVHATLEPEGPASVNLPGGVRLRRRGGRLFIS